MTQRVYTQTLGVAGAIIEKDGKVLLVKETKPSAKDKWNHPAGWLEVGENPIEAVMREVSEETGFDFEPKGILGVYSLSKQGGAEAGHHAVKIIFWGNISDGQGKYIEEEIAETKWFAPEEIYEMGPETLRDLDVKQIVKDYFSGIKYPLDLITHTIQPK